jgi:hypothetical protein
MIPDYESLMPFVLELARTENSIRDATAALSDKLGLTEDER